MVDPTWYPERTGQFWHAWLWEALQDPHPCLPSRGPLASSSRTVLGSRGPWFEKGTTRGYGPFLLCIWSPLKVLLFGENNALYCTPGSSSSTSSRFMGSCKFVLGNDFKSYCYGCYGIHWIWKNDWNQTWRAQFPCDRRTFSNESNAHGSQAFPQCVPHGSSKMWGNSRSTSQKQDGKPNPSCFSQDRQWFPLQGWFHTLFLVETC